MSHGNPLIDFVFSPLAQYDRVRLFMTLSQYTINMHSYI